MTIKTAVGILILFATVFILSLPVEAVTQQKTAIIRASDEHVYEVHYTQPISIENFSIHGLDGEMPSHGVAAELYIAASILNRPPTAVDIYSGNELWTLVHEECLHTAEWNGYHEIATYIGSKSANLLVGLATGSFDILKESVEAILEESIETIIEETIEAIIEETIELLAEELALLVLEEMNLFVKKERVLLEACIVTQSYVVRAMSKKQIFDEFVSSAEAGTEVSIADIKSAYNALLQADLYVKYVHWMLDEYIVLPDRWERLWTFAKTIFPPTALGQFFASQGQNIEDLRNLQTVFAESDSRVATEVFPEVTAAFSETTKSKFIWNLASAGFFDREPPTIERFIEDMQLMVSDGSRLFDLATIFSDPNGDQLEHTVEVTDGNIADVELILFRPDGESVFKPFLEITPKRIGITEVVLEATDPTHLSATQTFTVAVEPAEAPNQPPQAINRIPAQSLTMNSASPPLDVSVYFHDPDGGTIFYTAESSNPAVAITQRTGSEITILPQGIGTATITVTAANSDGASVTQMFTVTVTTTETPTEPPTPQGLRVGDTIIVQNTGSVGLNIRSTPEVSNQAPDNRMGKVYDGGTGTIIAGPQQDVEGRTWWEVEWDASDKVQWQHPPTNNRGWSVEATEAVGLLALRPSEPVTQSFDLEIRPLSVSKQTLDPGESFTLSITIHNNGPGTSVGPTLSYYYSSIQGFSPTDPPQLQGTVELDPLASGERITKLIQLAAPATPKTYYYGAWLAANTGDTNFNNDFATEVGVTVVDDTIDEPVDPSDPPDLVIADISVDYDTMFSGEKFTISATVENAGGKWATNIQLRFYRSSDRIYSSDDEEIPNTSEFISRLHGGETGDEDANFRAPNEQGVYYYIARAEPVRNEVDTDNNYDTIKITVLPPPVPDLVVSLTSTRYLVDPDQRFLLDATVLNQGQENSREKTIVRFYRSSDAIPSPDDEEIGIGNITTLREGSTDRESQSDRGPSEMGGISYYYACVDSISEERNTDNNCSNVVTITVRSPDLVINSVSVDYRSRTNTVYPNSIFDLDVTIRNQGTEDADDSTLRYYISSDPILSSDDIEVATDYVFSLDMNETSKTYKENDIPVPYTSGFFYALVCVDGVEGETDTDNNCYAPIKITVRNFGPRAKETIPEQTLSVGTPVSVDISAYFTDVNNDNLTYTASSGDLNIATVSVSDAHITITPQQTGSTTITVTANDGEFTATQTFTVSIVGEEAWMPDATLRAAVRTALGIQPNDALTQQAMDGLIILNAASNQAGTGVQDITGLEHATQLSILNLGRTGVRDLTPLQGLTQLTQLTLWYTNIWDLSPLQGLTNLTHLNLHQTAPRSISPLQGLINLTSLDIGRTRTSDLTPISRLTALTDLNLSFNNLNDLTLLGNLTTLTSLNLGYTTPSDITPLKDLTALTYLDLKNNQISDISSVSGLTQLIWLYLEGNQISDVSPLEGLTSLQFLFLKYNPIADTAPLQRLKQKNPNLSIDVDIEIQVPDLFIDSVSADKNTVAPSEKFQLSVAIQNGGEADSIATPLRYYLSTDDTISDTDTEVHATILPVVAVDATDEPPSIELTAPNTPGIYYYGVCVDAVAHESDTNNNCSTAVAVTVLGSDLLVSAVSVDKNTVLPGEKFQLSAVIENRGKAEASAITVNYYQSIDDTISDTDTELNTAILSRIAGEAKAEPSIELTAPDTPGIYYYGVCVDAVAHESDINNNCSTAVMLTVGGADLIVESVEANRSAVAPGKNFHIQFTIRNQGKADSTRTTVRYYLSTDDTISAEDTEIDTSNLFTMTVDTTREPLLRLTAPDTPGIYYYGACIDAIAGESDTSNNCSDAVAVSVTGPDLVVDPIRVNKAAVKPGENFQIIAGVHNQGKVSSTPTVIRYYLSTDDTISTADTLIATRDITSQLSAGATTNRSWLLLTAPDTPGTYYYGACVDAIEHETDTTNNCSDAIAITVEGADLRIDGTPQVSKTTLLPGETFQINTRVWNQGSATSDATTLRYYLSTDDTISSEDTEVDSDSLAALSGRGAHASRRRTELSKTLTAPDTPGDYYYGVCVDPVAGDADITNNCSEAIAITVEAPPEPIVDPATQETQDVEAVEIQGPDLIISAARVDASTVKQGGGVRMHITVRNQGTSGTGATTVRYYRSSDATITTEDTEVRAALVGALGAGKLTTTWAILPTPFSVGTYYYGACMEGVESEFDTTNNCSDAIEITVERQGDEKPQLRPVGTISTQELEVEGSAVVLNVSGYFFGEVETWTASSNKTEVVTVSMSGSEVTLTPVGEGWATVTITASSGDLAAKQTFSVSVGGAAVPEPVPTVVLEPDKDGTSDPSPPVPPPIDTSPEVSIPDVGLRETLEHTLGLPLHQDAPITQQMMAGLTTLDVYDSVEDLTGLEHATNLIKLIFHDHHGNYFSDLTPLTNLTKLTHLELKSGRFTDITPLRNLTSLTILSLTDTYEFSDITPLQNLTNLTQLYLDSNRISNITPLANLTNLTRLDLSRNEISDLTPLQNLTNLTYLYVTQNQISNITPITNLTNLTELSFHVNQISNITPLQNLTALTKLALDQNQISNITPLQNLTNLTQLASDHNQISNITPLQNMTLLSRLDLAGNQISNITPLQNMTLLSYLNLWNNQVSDITPLTNLTALTELYLYENQISDVTPLEGLTSLRVLSLRGNPIEDVAPLRRLKEKNPSVRITGVNLNNAPTLPLASMLPAETALFSNYPNPFNPETWIPYQLAEASDVTLTIYDVRGIIVRRLALGHRPPGFYYSRGRAAHWDGKNEIGEKVASGLYFYTFTAGDFTATQKLLIRK